MRDLATRKSMRKAMKILLAVDGSEASLAAVEEAAQTPWPEGSIVRIVSVTDIPFAIESPAKTLKGDPKIVILDEAERWGADLIVVGTHGYDALGRIRLSSVSRVVASHAKCSVKIARHRKTMCADGRAMRILLAVDGSEFGGAAVEEVANRPWPPGSEVHVVSAIHLSFMTTPETWALPDSYCSHLEEAGRELAGSAINRAISRLLDSNKERKAPLTLTNEAIVSHAAEAIIETAKKWSADLVTLGSHGNSGFKRCLLGSVSYAVASHAPCSVEIVRTPILQEEKK